MIKKIVLIGGSVLLVGGLAFLYFRNKKKTDDLLSGSTIPSSGATTSTTGVATSPIDSEIPPLSSGGIVASGTSVSLPNEENLAKAQNIVKKIKEYEKASLVRAMSSSKKIGSIFTGTISNPYPNLIKKLKNDLSKLGYKYDNNLLSKI